MNRKIKNYFNQTGAVAQLPLVIGLLLIGVALPAGLRLVQQQQEIRREAVPECRGINYYLPSNIPPNQTICVSMDRRGASNCFGNWDNAWLLHNGNAVGVGLGKCDGSDQSQGYHAHINTGPAGSNHNLRLTFNNQSCHCNLTSFRTSEITEVAAPTCQFTSAPQTVQVGESATFTVSASGGSNNLTQIQLHKRVDDQWVAIGRCDNTGTCTKTTTFSKPGEYWVVCNAFNDYQPTSTKYSQCSGNPFGSFDDWADCGNDSRKRITVVEGLVPTPTPTATPPLGPTPTPTTQPGVPTSTPTPTTILTDGLLEGTLVKDGKKLFVENDRGESGGVVTFTVREETRLGNSVAGALVQISQYRGSRNHVVRTGRTDSEGRVSLNLTESAGQYNYAVSKNGYIPHGGCFTTTDHSQRYCQPREEIKFLINNQTAISGGRPGDIVTLSWEVYGPTRCEAKGDLWSGYLEMFRGTTEIRLPESDDKDFYKFMIECWHSGTGWRRIKTVNVIMEGKMVFDPPKELLKPRCSIDDLTVVGGTWIVKTFYFTGLPEGCETGHWYYWNDPVFRNYIDQKYGPPISYGNNWTDENDWRYRPFRTGCGGDACPSGYMQVIVEPGRDQNKICIEESPCAPYFPQLKVSGSSPVYSFLNVGQEVTFRIGADEFHGDPYASKSAPGTGYIEGARVTMINTNNPDDQQLPLTKTGITDSRGYVTLRTDNKVFGGRLNNIHEPYWGEGHKHDLYILALEKEGYLPRYNNFWVYEVDNPYIPSSQEREQQYSASVVDDNCPRKSEGDANCDGKIDIFDFSIWRQEKFDRGADTIQGDWQADFNGDGYVDEEDLKILLQNWD